MSTYSPLHRIAALGALGVLVLSSLAAYIQDNFSNANVPSFWVPNESGGGKAVRTGGALAISVQDNGEDISFGGYLNSKYTIDFNSSWAANFTYSLAGLPPAPSGARAGAALFMGFGGGKGPAIFAFAAYRSNNGYFLGLMTFGGGGPEFEPLCPIPTSGKITLSYMAVQDRLVLKVNNQTRFTFQDLTMLGGASGPAFFGLGGLAVHGMGSYNFHNGIKIDNFSFSGPGLVNASPF